MISNSKIVIDSYGGFPFRFKRKMFHSHKIHENIEWRCKMSEVAADVVAEADVVVSDEDHVKSRCWAGVV